MLRKFLLASVALVSLASAANAAPVDDAIAAMLAAGDLAQVALEIDVCEDSGLFDGTGKSVLLPNSWDGATYDRIREQLARAYAATSGTDGELDAVRDSFCEAVSNR